MLDAPGNDLPRCQSRALVGGAVQWRSCLLIATGHIYLAKQKQTYAGPFLISYLNISQQDRNLCDEQM
jgi:hypothetical protein